MIKKHLSSKNMQYKIKNKFYLALTEKQTTRLSIPVSISEIKMVLMPKHREFCVDFFDMLVVE